MRSDISVETSVAGRFQFDSQSLPYAGLSFLLHVGLLAATAFFVPNLAMANESDGMSAEHVRADVREHPITALKDLGFRVTLNTDNRLVSGTTMTREMSLLVEQAGWGVEDLRTVTVNALKSAFMPFDERVALVEDVVLPGYAAAL